MAEELALPDAPQERRSALLGTVGRLLDGLRTFVPPFLALAVIWEVVVQLHIFPAVLMPSLVKVGATFVELIENGVLWRHLSSSLWRLVLGYLVGSALGVLIGLLMGRLRWVERFVLPLISALMPIPALAWVPLFILWFGLGEGAVFGIILFAVVLPVIFNSWTGVKTVNPVLLRAAQTMRCRGPRLFLQVILPAALAMIFAGLRIGLAQAWRALVAGEMLSSTNWGLGWAIFDSREFLATDVMLVMILVIGFSGYLIVVVLFELIERYTVVRWGMFAGGQGG